MLLNFNIPKELYKQIGEYDLAKPKEIKSVPVNVKPIFPKAGIPEQLIPEEIYPRDLLLNAIRTLNNTQTDRYYNAVRTITFIHNNKDIAITKLANKYWSAIWFEREGDEVIFNYSIALRDLKSYKTGSSARVFHQLKINEEDFTKVTHNKKAYLYYYKQVTKQDLIDRKYNSDHLIFNQYNADTFYRAFKHKLRKAINIWENSGIFCAYNESLASVLGVYAEKDNFSWVPTFEWVMENKRLPERIKEKLNTPFFRKKICPVLQQIVDNYNSPDFNRKDTDLKFNHLEVFSWIDTLYGDTVSIDHLQQIWNALNFDSSEDKYYTYFYLNSSKTSLASQWICDNVPISSFINMMSKNFNLIKDTVDMIGDIIRRKTDLSYDGRWRVQEFHDWIMAEHWKLSNKNEKLPQDLFPNPVKVDDLTFIQPVNTHFLAQWGKAARNCVGSSTYSNGILKKDHFIILALEKNSPHLTIQARLEDENLRIVQIKKTCNANLNSAETAYYHKLFAKALEIRSEELKNAVC